MRLGRLGRLRVPAGRGAVNGTSDGLGWRPAAAR